MKEEELSSESLIELEAPSIDINLGAALGFVPVKLKIPLPKIRNPFSAVSRRPFILPFKRLELRLRAWWDARRWIPELTTGALSAFEMEIVNQSDRKTRDIQLRLSPQKLDLTRALNALEPCVFNADESLKAVRNQCAEGLATLADWQARMKQWLEQATLHKDATRKALLDFASKANLPSSVPRAQLKKGQLWPSLILLSLVDLALSVPLVHANPDLGLLKSTLLCVAFTIMNLVIGLAGGCFIASPYIRQPESEYRPLLRALLVIWVAAGVALNLLFGVVRNHDSSNSWPLGVALVIAGITLFGWFGVKGYRDFADPNPGHLDRWWDHVTARNIWNRAYKAQRQADVSVHKRRAEMFERVRAGTTEYEEALGGTRTAAKDCQAALKAQRDLIPALAEEFQDTGRTLIALYRECGLYWRRKWGDAPPNSAAPKPDFADVPFAIEEDVKLVAEIVTALDRNRTQLTRFRELFEDYVAGTPGAPAFSTRPSEPAGPQAPAPDSFNGAGLDAQPGVVRSSDGRVTAWSDKS